MDAERIAAENLSVWREAAAENRELRLLQLTQLAKETAARGGTEPSPELLPRALREEVYTVCPIEERVCERVAFCRELLNARPDLLPARITGVLPPVPRVATLTGPVFSLALSRFFGSDIQARPIRLSSLAELLEEVGAGNADFALIPMEDTKGARLLHFHEEFDRLELHVVGLCRVSVQDEGRGTRFALVTRLCNFPAPTSAELLLECRLTCEAPDALLELLNAARGAGLTLRRADSLPAPYLEDSITYFTVFSGPARAQELLELYLSICLPRAAVIGRYFLLTEENQ